MNKIKYFIRRLKNTSINYILIVISVGIIGLVYIKSRSNIKHKDVNITTNNISSQLNNKKIIKNKSLNKKEAKVITKHDNKNISNKKISNKTDVTKDDESNNINTRNKLIIKKYKDLNDELYITNQQKKILENKLIIKGLENRIENKDFNLIDSTSSESTDNIKKSKKNKLNKSKKPQLKMIEKAKKGHHYKATIIYQGKEIIVSSKSKFGQHKVMKVEKDRVKVQDLNSSAIYYLK